MKIKFITKEKKRDAHIQSVTVLQFTNPKLLAVQVKYVKHNLRAKLIP